MKKKLRLFILLPMILIGVTVTQAQKGKSAFEKMQKEKIRNDKLGKALDAEANKKELRIDFSTSCSGVTGKAKNVMATKVSRDEVLVIRAGGYPSSGHKWMLAPGYKGAFDLIVDDLGPSAIPGAKADFRFVLRSKSKGTSSLRFVYRRSWVDEVVKEYVINVSSDGAYKGDFNFVKEAPKVVEAVEETPVKGLKAAIDWRSSGKVTSVKSQGSTSACWAFGTCASTESAILMAGGASRDLSEQYLCNCASGSCSSGGWFAHWLFLDDGRGAVYESQVPFQNAGDYACGTYTYHEKLEKWGWTDGISDTGWPSKTHNASNAQIKAAIQNYGPIAANCMSSCWANSSGIQNVNCTGGAHIVTIVGYNDSPGYWIVKNSWGSGWGDGGYLYLMYNTCQMGLYSIYCKAVGGTTTDTQAPSVPSNVTITGTTENSISLSWSASTDNVGVTSYTINNSTDNKNYTATGTSYTVTGLTANKNYTFYINAKDAAGNTSGWSSAANGKTEDGGTSGGYCASKGSNVSYEWIAGVKIGSYNKTSAANGGYADFTNETVNVSNGASVTLTPGFSGSAYTEHWKIWIDVNKNEVFDSNEEVFSSSGNGAVSGTINMPSGSGTTRMRVSMNYNSAPTACQALTYGEVEDYTVNMSGSSTDTQAPSVPSNVSVTSTTSSSISLSWTASTDNVGVTSYTINNATDNQTYSTSGTSYTVSGLTANKNYTFYVNAKDAAGNTSSWSSAASGKTDEGTVNPPTYCESKGSNQNYEYIDLVQLGSINRTSASDGGYILASNTTTLSAGSSYTMSYSAYISGTYTEHWRVWIDFNQDGDFNDSGETVISNSSSSTATLTGTVAVPSNALAGKTRMRVSMKYNAAPTSCESIQYGEVEDYEVTIAPGASMASLKEDKVNAYPNPVIDGTLIVKTDSDNFVIKLLDITGKIVLVKQGSNNVEQVNVSGLSGVYLLLVESGKEVICKEEIIIK